MGRPYAEELGRLSGVYDWARTTPVDELSGFVKRSAGRPLYVIGSGGSFSAATFASVLHQNTGMIARCMTPLEFLGYDRIDGDCSVLVVTAGGNNGDILAAFERAVRMEPLNLGIVCASTDNRLVARASGSRGVSVHAVDPPTGKDGFLATNTLVATVVWLLRAYAAAGLAPSGLPCLDDLAFCGLSQARFEENLAGRLEVLGGRSTLVCLYDNWGQTAAVDIESKLSEAGLAGVQPADYRSFAHGRHNWLDKNRETTGIVALVAPRCRDIAEATLRLVPGYIPAVTLSVGCDGPAGSVGLLVQSMFVAKFFGIVRGIDPGRPGVADFGRELYNMSVRGYGAASGRSRGQQ